MAGGMTGKALVFVRGHKHPTVAPLTARFVLRHPDGAPMLALSTRDTLEACAARWERAQQVVEEKPARKRTKKEEDDA
jgi:hypothetical protein